MKHLNNCKAIRRTDSSLLLYIVYTFTSVSFSLLNIHMCDYDLMFAQSGGSVFEISWIKKIVLIVSNCEGMPSLRESPIDSYCTWIRRSFGFHVCEAHVT